jgi:TrmH family RNA methyltransferase
LAVFEIKETTFKPTSGLELALDNIKDPGNMGTIIRLCDWFGISKIVCTEETVDIYNPKVVQATMGSLARVQVEYTNLVAYLKATDLEIFGTFMDGENIYKKELPSNGILVMGNEANGISSEIEQLVTQKIAIPRFGNLQQTESLNVATATAIFLSEFKRSE